MSRLLLACSLVTALTSQLAFADRAFEAPPPPHPFAQPPPAHPERAADHADVVLDRATVRAALAEARARNLAAFRAYQARGVFPSNTFDDGKLNVWRDRDGHFCAAATIIKASGQLALVERVAEQTNFIRLADVSQGPLMDWILTSGFTQAEIAAIQEPFMPVTRRPQPVEPAPVIDARLRKQEDARLRARYTEVTRALVRDEARSLDLATERLLAHPGLAWALVESMPTGGAS
ncbi:MAG TPA: hypothetical protein VLX92_10465 [Kofleriaceae bacterium]|nr:hypothetical protein [Kofleriaceae bacterium]